MRLILSPAKTLDFACGHAAATAIATTPQHWKNSAEIMAELRTKSTAQLKKLLNVSDNITKLNQARNESFDAKSAATQPKEALFKQAVLSYDGPAFKGMDAATLDATAAGYLQVCTCVCVCVCMCA